MSARPRLRCDFPLLEDSPHVFTPAVRIKFPLQAGLDLGRIALQHQLQARAGRCHAGWRRPLEARSTAIELASGIGFGESQTVREPFHRRGS